MARQEEQTRPSGPPLGHFQGKRIAVAQLVVHHATAGRDAITPSVRARTSGEARHVATAS